MKNKKFDEYIEEELVELVNKMYADPSKKSTLESIATDLGAKKSQLHAKLSGWGYRCKNRQYVKLNAEKAAEKVAELDAMYLLTQNFNKQISHKVNADTYKEFEAFCGEHYPNINMGKLVSLALKEFIEKHK